MRDHNVIPIRGQQKVSDDAPDLMDRWMVAQLIVDAGDRLTSSEAELLHAVNRLSAGYGSAFCLKSRAEVARTARMSLATYERVVPRLVLRGVLVREATFHYNRLSIDREVLENMVNLPKRVRQNEGPPLPHFEGPPSLKMREPIEENPREEKPREEKPPSPQSGDGVVQEVEKVNQDHQRRDELSRNRCSASALQKRWDRVWPRHFSAEDAQPVGWCTRESACMRSVAKRLRPRGASYAHELVEWFLGEWSAVRERFSWLRDGPPRHPSPRFLSAMFDHVVEAHDEWRAGRRWEITVGEDVAGLPAQDRLNYYEGLAEEARERRRQRRRDREW